MGDQLSTVRTVQFMCEGRCDTVSSVYTKDLPVVPGQFSLSDKFPCGPQSSKGIHAGSGKAPHALLAGAMPQELRIDQRSIRPAAPSSSPGLAVAQKRGQIPGLMALSCTPCAVTHRHSGRIAADCKDAGSHSPS